MSFVSIARLDYYVIPLVSLVENSINSGSLLGRGNLNATS